MTRAAGPCSRILLSEFTGQTVLLNCLRGGKVKKVVITSLALGAWLLCAATGVLSVRSTDTSTTSNTVSIELSDPAQYRVQELPGGNGVRVTIQDVQSLQGSPSYPRLSQVIDAVSAQMVGGYAIIDIKTMDGFAISHQANSDNSRITVLINAAVPVPSVPKPAGSPVPAGQSFDPPQALPRKVNQPEVIHRRPEPPQTRSAGAASAETAVESSTAETLPPPGQDQPATPGMDPTPQAGADLAPASASEGAPSAADQDPPAPERGSLLLYLVLAGAALLGLSVILKFLVRKPPEEEAVQAPNPDPETPLEGDILLLDPATRRRMVQKLLGQGWSSSQIAREMRLGVREVEEIVADLKGGKR